MLPTTKMAATSSFTNLQRSYSALPSVLILGVGEHTLIPHNECTFVAKNFWQVCPLDAKTWKFFLPKTQNSRVFPRMYSLIISHSSQAFGMVSSLWGFSSSCFSICLVYVFASMNISLGILLVPRLLCLFCFMMSVFIYLSVISSSCSVAWWFLCFICSYLSYSYSVFEDILDGWPSRFKAVY